MIWQAIVSGYEPCPGQVCLRRTVPFVRVTVPNDDAVDRHLAGSVTPIRSEPRPGAIPCRLLIDTAGASVTPTAQSVPNPAGPNGGLRENWGYAFCLTEFHP